MASALEDLVGAMSLSELAQRSGKSVQAIVDYALGGKTTPRPSSSAPSGNGVPSRAGKKATTKKGARRAASRSVNTRTPEGRAAFDERVLDAVRSLGGSAQSADIERIVGGTPEQRRVALARLLKSRKLTRSGKARSTAYSVR
jgi:hypothetical protein